MPPTKTKSSLTSLVDSNQPMPKLSEIYLEIKDDFSKQPQYEKEAHFVVEAGEKNPSIEDIPTDLLVHEADIFRKLGIPWVPEAEQDPTAGRSFDSDKENLQKTIQNLQQRNEELIKKINDMEQRQKKAKRQARALDGISLLDEAAKNL